MILLSVNEQDKQLFFECASFLPLEDIAKLASVDHLLHASIRKCASIWKQCIRASDISPAIRCSVWLSILYGKTPWQSGTTVPHHLSAAETRVKIYEQLLMKVGSRMASGSLRDTDSASISEERQQLLSWLHEIDVDVTRTCTKDIYAGDAVRTRERASERMGILLELVALADCRLSLSRPCRRMVGVWKLATQSWQQRRQPPPATRQSRVIPSILLVQRPSRLEAHNTWRRQRRRHP